MVRGSPPAADPPPSANRQPARELRPGPRERSGRPVSPLISFRRRASPIRAQADLPALGLLAAAAGLAVSLAVRKKQQEKKGPSLYEVQEGDTLCSIAACLNTSPKRIVELNTDIITNPNFIYPVRHPGCGCGGGRVAAGRLPQARLTGSALARVRRARGCGSEREKRNPSRGGRRRGTTPAAADLIDSFFD